MDLIPVKSRTFTRLLIPLMGLLACSLKAQSPEYRPPPPPSNKAAIEVRMRYLISPDISFTGLGSIPRTDSFSLENNLFLGTERAIFYDDGQLVQDYISADLIEGGGTNQELIPSPNTEATSNFVYTDEAQVDGTSLLFHRYMASAPTDVEFEGDGSGSLGWEINYTRYISRKYNLGLQVGFSFNGFDSRFNEDIDASIYRETYRHQMADGAAVPGMPDVITDDAGNETQPPYQGDAIRDDAESGDLLEWLATKEPTEEVLEGAVVNSRADLRSSVYNFRAGPTYSANFGERIAFQMGAGLSAIYFSGRFSAYEALSVAEEGINVSRNLTTTEDAEWQVGGYVDASAYYRFTERVSLFSGLQVQSGSTYSQMNEERQASVDFSSQVYVHAGLGIRF